MWERKYIVAPFVPLDFGAQTELVFEEISGTLLENRLWFVRRTGTVDAGNLLELSEGVRDWWRDNLKPYLSHQLQLLLVQSTDWTAFGNTPVVAAVPFDGRGSDSDDMHSATVAVDVAFDSVIPPRPIRNRNFVSGIPLGQVDFNVVSLTFQSHMIDAYARLIDVAAFFGTFPAWRWVCTSQFSGGAPRITQDYRAASLIKLPSPYVSNTRKRQIG